jgi:predicted nucleotidyltransferase
MDGLVEKVSGFFSKYPEVKVAYVFGSQAKGTASKLSDVDIAVLLDEELAPSERLELQMRFINELMRLLRQDDVDVAVLNDASLVLAHQVLKYGQLIHCADEQARFRFTYETYRDYLDTAYMRRVQWEYLRHRIKEGRFGDRRTDYQAALEEIRRKFGQAP